MSVLERGIWAKNLPLFRAHIFWNHWSDTFLRKGFVYAYQLNFIFPTDFCKYFFSLCLLSDWNRGMKFWATRGSYLNVVFVFTACEFGVLLYFAFVFDVVIVIAVSQIQLKAENDNGGHQWEGGASIAWITDWPRSPPPHDPHQWIIRVFAFVFAFVFHLYFWPLHPFHIFVVFCLFVWSLMWQRQRRAWGRQTGITRVTTFHHKWCQSPLKLPGWSKSWL